MISSLREIDAAVAEGLGRKTEVLNLGEFGTDLFYTDVDNPFVQVPCYSADCNATLKLDAEMKERGWSLELDRGSDSVVATYSRHDPGIGGFMEATSVASDIPKAITSAANKALKSSIRRR